MYTRVLRMSCRNIYEIAVLCGFSMRFHFYETSHNLTIIHGKTVY